MRYDRVSKFIFVSGVQSKICISQLNDLNEASLKRDNKCRLRQLSGRIEYRRRSLDAINASVNALTAK